MRRVRFKSLDAGPGGVRHPGSVHALQDNEAKALVDGGFADYVDPPPVREAAVRPPAPETTAHTEPPTPFRQTPNRPVPPDPARGRRR